MKSLIKKITPSFLLDWYYLSLPFFGAILYRFPSRKIKVIGVTGTNGKSTVVHLITQIFKEAGFKVAMLSSIEFWVGEKTWPNTLKMTMPGRMKVQKFLRQAVNAGCDYAVLEVTSEGIKQHRHSFIDFTVAVFTNLTPEHVESHGGFEKYREAKGKLFKVTKKIHIINRDDPNAEYFLKFPAQKKFLYGIKDKDLVLQSTKLLGEFNIYNALAALRVGLSQGIDFEICKRGLEKFKGVPGRMEIVIQEPFKVIVDYAHTPDALRKAYETVTHQLINSSTNKLVCVLGSAGGGRDKWKRPELGKIAARYCNEIIITNEDPYDEPPGKILEEVAQGALNAQKILDRREAIRRSLELAKPGDTVIITGKGCEPWLCVAGGKKVSWDDRQVVREELSKLKIPLAP